MLFCQSDTYVFYGYARLYLKYIPFPEGLKVNTFMQEIINGILDYLGLEVSIEIEIQSNDKKK